MAGRIPQSFIDDLVARADIIEVVGSRVELKKAGREYKGLCPFHNENTPSFTVSPNKGFYHCFGCGAHGTALGFLMEHDHLTFVEAVEELAGMLAVDVPRETGGPPRDSKLDSLVELMDRVAELYVEALRSNQRAIDYLQKRGIDGNTARDFRIGYAPDAWDTVLRALPDNQATHELLVAAGLVIQRDSGGYYDRFRDRIMFPIRDTRGRIVGFGGRVLDKGEPKYLNSPETVLFHKGRELYGLFELRKKLRDIPKIVVVEGYMDVVGLARNGVRFAVATLGTATTAEHVDRLFRITDTVVFAFDGDRAGRQAAWRAMTNALPRLTDGRELRFAFMPDGEDPDSLVAAGGPQAFERVLEAAQPLSDFLVSELAAEVDPTSAEGRAKLAEQAKPLLATLPAGVYRELLIGAVAKAIDLAPAKFEAMLGPAPSAASAAPSRNPLSANRPRASAMRRAITLLLHEPDAALEYDLAPLEHLNRPGAELLRELISHIQAHGSVQPAVLLEQFRHHHHYSHLEKLAAGASELDAVTDVRADLAGYLEQLADLARHDRVEHLRTLAGAGELDADGRDELRILLGQRSGR